MTTPPENILGVQILDWLAAQLLVDDDLRERFAADPKAVLRESGIEIDDETRVHVHRNTPEDVHFVVPAHVEPSSELDPGERCMSKLVRTTVM